MGMFDSDPNTLGTFERLLSNPKEAIRRQALAQNVASRAVPQLVRKPWEVVTYVPYVRVPGENGSIVSALN